MKLYSLRLLFSRLRDPRWGILSRYYVSAVVRSQLAMSRLPLYKGDYRAELETTAVT